MMLGSDGLFAAFTQCTFDIVETDLISLEIFDQLVLQLLLYLIDKL